MREDLMYLESMAHAFRSMVESSIVGINFREGDRMILSLILENTASTDSPYDSVPHIGEYSFNRFPAETTPPFAENYIDDVARNSPEAQQKNTWLANEDRELKVAQEIQEHPEEHSKAD